MIITTSPESFNDYYLGVDTIFIKEEDHLSLSVGDTITVNEEVWGKPTGRSLTLKVVEARQTSNDTIWRVQCIQYKDKQNEESK